MGHYKELDIERIHQEEAEESFLASIQPLLGEEFLLGERSEEKEDGFMNHEPAPYILLRFD